MHTKTKDGANALTLALMACKDLGIAVPLATALNDSHTTGEICPLAMQLMRSHDIIRMLLDANASVFDIDLPRVLDKLLEESEIAEAQFHAQRSFHYGPILK